MIQNFEHGGVVMDPPPKIDIEKLVEMRLPQAPGGMMRINTLLRNENASSKAISDAISIEPTLVTRIIRLANSPLYSLIREVVSVKTAVDAIGTKEIENIVMMEITSAAFAKEIRNSEIAGKIWKHSLAVAVLSRQLSRAIGVRSGEEIFTCGLLHDIGKLILLSHDNETFKCLLEINSENEYLKTERKLFGYNHAEIGSLVARRWELPDVICYSILYHHDPTRSDQAALVTNIVNVADQITNIEGYGLRNESREKLMNSESVFMLGLDGIQMENAWETAKISIDELLKTFSK